MYRHDNRLLCDGLPHQAQDPGRESVEVEGERAIQSHLPRVARTLGYIEWGWGGGEMELGRG